MKFEIYFPVAYEVYGRCAQRFSESWKVGDPDIKFAKKEETANNNNNKNINNSNNTNNNNRMGGPNYPPPSEGESRHDRDIIDFIKEIMVEEHSVKSDMIEVGVCLKSVKSSIYKIFLKRNFWDQLLLRTKKFW